MSSKKASKKPQQKQSSKDNTTHLQLKIPLPLPELNAPEWKNILTKEKFHSKPGTYRKPWLFGLEPELEKRDPHAAYKNMLQQEINRVSHEQKFGAGDILMRIRALHLMSKLCDVREDEQSGHVALRLLLSSLKWGLIPPPWVAEKVLEIFTKRSNKEIKSLDIEFGYVPRGERKRTFPLAELLFQQRNDWIGRSIIILKGMGYELEGAFELVAHYFLHKKGKDWKWCGWEKELQITRNLKTGKFKEKCPKCDLKLFTEVNRAEESVRKIYFDWLILNPEYKNPTHPLRKSVTTENQEDFIKIFS